MIITAKKHTTKAGREYVVQLIHDYASNKPAIKLGWLEPHGDSVTFRAEDLDAVIEAMQDIAEDPIVRTV